MPERVISHYRLVRQIGRGGMGVIYEAEDLELGRHVALKFLPDALADESGALERLRREARAASSLNHPGICTVYEIGRAATHPFIAMELLDGQSLNDQIAGHPMRLDELLETAVQVAEALDAAHTSGILHRDIKPANIFITRHWRVKLLDFGLAKLIGQQTLQPVGAGASTADSPAPCLTSPGMAVGTIAYMSPEQARGEDLDSRSDLFSFGVVLYQMATGKLPFEGKTAPLLFDEILNKQPVSPMNLNPSLPARLAEIINAALEKKRELRFQSAADMRAELMRLQRDLESTSTKKSGRSAASTEGRDRAKKNALTAVLALLVALSVAVAIYIRTRPSEAAALDSIVVLPFTNASGNGDSDYLSDGLTEGIINNLSEVPNLKVVARSTAFHFKNADTPRQAGKQLGVKAALFGTLRQRGNEVQLQVDLVNVADDTEVWGRQYQRSMSEASVLQREVAEDIAERLRLRPTSNSALRTASPRPMDAEAYRLYLQGRFFWNKRDAASLKKAMDYFQQVIARDSSYAQAYVGLADCYGLLNQADAVPATESMPQAKAALDKALALEPNLAEAHASMGIYLNWYGWDYSGSERELRRAIELNPNYASAHHWLAISMAQQGHFDEAEAEINRALEIDPLSPAVNTGAGFISYLRRDYGTAIVRLEKSLEIDPSNGLAMMHLGFSYAHSGLKNEAVAVLNNKPVQLAYVQALAGEPAAAQKLVRQMEGESVHRYVPAIWFVFLYTGLKEKDHALVWLERAYLERSVWLVNVNEDADFDPLRSDPRFRELLKKINMAK